MYPNVLKCGIFLPIASSLSSPPAVRPATCWAESARPRGPSPPMATHRCSTHPPGRRACASTSQKKGDGWIEIDLDGRCPQWNSDCPKCNSIIFNYIQLDWEHISVKRKQQCRIPNKTSKDISKPFEIIRDTVSMPAKALVELTGHFGLVQPALQVSFHVVSLLGLLVHQVQGASDLCNLSTQQWQTGQDDDLESCDIGCPCCPFLKMLKSMGKAGSKDQNSHEQLLYPRNRNCLDFLLTTEQKPMIARGIWHLRLLWLGWKLCFGEFCQNEQNGHPRSLI